MDKLLPKQNLSLYFRNGGSNEFKYLGSYVCKNWNNEKQISTRMGSADAAFKTLYK